MGLVDGKIVIVTGAGSGIGRAAAAAFAREGAALVVVGDRDVTAADETVAMVAALGGDARVHEVDVTVESEVAALVDAVAAAGPLDIAFNNAGRSDSSRPFVDLELADWDRMIAANLTSVFLCMKHELAVMTAQGHGAIVNTASGAGLTAAPGLPHYTAAKHGVLGLTKAASAEYTDQPGIRVNAILPGMTATPMLEGWFGSSPDIAEAVARTLPGRTFGRPEDVAAAAVWLASDQARWISGAALVVDGGMLNL